MLPETSTEYLLQPLGKEYGPNLTRLLQRVGSVNLVGDGAISEEEVEKLLSLCDAADAEFLVQLGLSPEDTHDGSC